MKSNQLLISLTAISVFLFSCQSKQADLVGEWTGKTVNDCGHYMFNKDEVHIYTFSENGVCKHNVEVNNGEMDNTLTLPDAKYSLIKDSLILDNRQDSIGSRQAYKLEVQGKNEIELKKSYTDLEDSTKECHSIWMLTRK